MARSGAAITFSAATVWPCALRSGTATATTPSSCSSLAMQWSSRATASSMARKGSGSVRVCGVRRGSVGIEITESCFLSDADNVGCKLAAIRKAGLNVLIDDFGSGYSSLSYLRDIPANYLKIDKSFISGIDTSESLKAIVSGTCSVGRAVGMKIIAEGVETPGQLEAVVQCGCSLIQGFYIARPMPEEDFINFIQQFNNARKG